MVTKKTETPLERLVNAAVLAGSVIYCNGLFDLSEQLAFEGISEALKPFGGMPRTEAMNHADAHWKKADQNGKASTKKKEH